MARLFEFQAKELLAGAGVPIPRGRVAGSPREVESAARELGGPVVVKPQILEGQRGKRGLIASAATPEEAVRESQRLFAGDFWGDLPRRVLVEERVPAETEWYAAVVTDPAAKRPQLLVSSEGGVSVEEALAGGGAVRLPLSLSRPLRAFEVLDALRVRSVLTSRAAAALARVCVALAHLYRSVDARLVEVNPLAWTERGWVALDGRVAVDDDALFRHPGLQERLGVRAAEETGNRLPTPLELEAARIDAEDHRGSVHFVQLDPDGSGARARGLVPVAVQTVGTGAFLTVFDELVPRGYYPMNFCDTSGSPGAEKVYRAARLVLRQTGFAGFLFVTCVSSQDLVETAKGVLKALQETYPGSGGVPEVPTVLCFRGWKDTEALELLDRAGLRGRGVRLLGRETTEREAVAVLDQLIRQRPAEEVPGTGLRAAD